MVDVKEFVDIYTKNIFNNLRNSYKDFGYPSVGSSDPQPIEMIPCTKCGCYFAPSWADTPPHDICPHCKGGEKDE